MVRHALQLAPAGLLVVAVAASGTDAEAQVLQAPRRAAEVTTPRTAETPLTTSTLLTGSAFGGYDDNVSQGSDFGGQPGAPPPLLTQSGTIGQFEGGLVYRRSKGRSGIDFGAHGSGIIYGGASDLGPTESAAVTFGADTGLGRSTRLGVTEALTYDSTYGLGSLGVIEDPVAAPGELPTSSAVEGILNQKSWASQTGLSLTQSLTRRDSLNVGYDYSWRAFTGNNGETSSSNSANAGYTRTMSRTTQVSAQYAWAQSDYAGSFTAGPRRPVSSHDVEGSVAYTKRVSPRRSMHIGFGAGASHIETVSTDLLEPYSYWAPTGSVDARFDLSPTWTLSGDFRRTTTGFEGVSQETFISNVAGVALAGPVGDRVRLIFSTGGANGNVDASAAGTGSYTTFSVATQVGVTLTRELAISAQYLHYRYSFSTDTVLPESLPPQFNRNAFRVGLTLSLPLNSRQARPRT